jgi:hypothetical protein
MDLAFCIGARRIGVPEQRTTYTSMMTESYMDYLGRRLTVLDPLPTALHGQSKLDRTKFPQAITRDRRNRPFE